MSGGIGPCIPEVPALPDLARAVDVEGRPGQMPDDIRAQEGGKRAAFSGVAMAPMRAVPVAGRPQPLRSTFDLSGR